MAILWEERYKVGNSEIDVQHQELIVLTNEFLAANGKRQLIACAMRLFKYTREHFAFEEGIMREIGYPAISHHVEQHNILISKLSAIAEDIASDRLDKVNLTFFLSSWLLDHIGKSDAKLAAYVKLR